MRHGYYDEYCYLPLYIFCGEHLLGVRLRTADQDAAAGSREEVERIVARIRRAWPAVHIVLRADSGFCRDELLSWCEANAVDYVTGLARNARLRRWIEPQMLEAKTLQAASGKPARVFTEFSYETTTGSWSRARRVVAKAEQLEDKENARYVVSSLPPESWSARDLYEQLYCARGDMENRIKEQKMLFAKRVSAATMRANQLRLYLSAVAYVLMQGLRRLALQGTQFATAQVQTIRLKLLKIGASVRLRQRAFERAKGVDFNELGLPVPVAVRDAVDEVTLLGSTEGHTVSQNSAAAEVAGKGPRPIWCSRQHFFGSSAK